MTRDPKSGDMVHDGFVRVALLPLYRARVERDHLARHGTYHEWQRAEARVRELETRVA